MTEALSRPKPRIDDPEELDRVVGRLVERFDPIAIYLFGSRARGDAGKDSDYDLMLVLADDTTRCAPIEPSGRQRTAIASTPTPLSRAAELSLGEDTQLVPWSPKSRLTASGFIQFPDRTSGPARPGQADVDR